MLTWAGEASSMYERDKQISIGNQESEGDLSDSGSDTIVGGIVVGAISSECTHNTPQPQHPNAHAHKP